MICNFQTVKYNPRIESSICVDRNSNYENNINNNIIGVWIVSFSILLKLTARSPGVGTRAYTMTISSSTGHL